MHAQQLSVRLCTTLLANLFAHPLIHHTKTWAHLLTFSIKSELEINTFTLIVLLAIYKLVIKTVKKNFKAF